MRTAADGLIRSHHALRGVAAFLVLLYHFRDVTPSIGRSLDAQTSFLSGGRIWVDFFFMLSGFILSNVYGAGLTATAREGGALRHFYVARFARIYPLHLATLLVMIAIELSAYAFRPEIADAFATERKSWWSLVQQVTLTQSWLTMDRLEWNVPSWSISTEAFAYLCLPFLLPMLHHPNRLVRACLPIAALAIYVHTFSRFDDIGEQQPLVRCLAGFVTGMLLYRLWQSQRQRLAAVAGPLQLAAVLVAIAALHLGWNQAVAVIALAILILATADDRAPLIRLLGWRPALLLGTLSYSVYMVHWIWYRLYWMYGNYIFDGLASAYSPKNVYALKVSSLIALTLALAFLSYRWIELPARSRLNSLLTD